jgi:TIR domain
MMPSVFFSYSHADEALRDQLEKQLALLKRQGIIDVWHDRRIAAGQDFAQEIDRHIETDNIILLLVSADFLASDYCYEKEMMRAMERHATGDAIVIPVILRACDWHGAQFGKLNATPPDGRPVTQFPDRDQALLEVARAVRSAAERFKSPSEATAPTRSQSPPPPATFSSGPRTSNLRIAKQFSERDKDAFRTEAFEYMAKFFGNSLQELSQRNPSVETSFRRIDANRFTAKAYKDGKAVSRCTIFFGGALVGGGIGYISSETTESNSYNELLSAEADDHALYLRGMGMSTMHGNDKAKLSAEGAAEFYWSMFVAPLQYNR